MEAVVVVGAALLELLAEWGSRVLVRPRGPRSERELVVDLSRVGRSANVLEVT